MKQQVQNLQQIIFIYDNLEEAISSFILDRKISGKRPNTIKFYTFNLRKFLEYCEAHSITSISELTAKFIKEFYLYLKENKGLSNNGIRAYHTALKVFFSWFFQEHEPDYDNFFEFVRPPSKEPKIFEGIRFEQVKLLLEHTKGRRKFNSIRDYTIIMVLFDCGIRASELINLEWKHINFPEREILIPAENAKGKRDRQVHFGEKTSKQIKKYMKFAKSEKYVFCSDEGDRLSYSALRQMLQRVSAKAAIQVELHDFRRGFALHKIQEEGLDILTVSRMMGHSSVELLARYVSQNSRDLKRKYKSAFDNDW